VRRADADALVGTGLAQMKAGDRQAAAQTFEQALRSAPSHVGALVSLGSALMGLGRLTEAEARYRQALAARPRQPVALRNLGVLFETHGRHAETLALADEALAAEPGHGEALYARGNALFGLGRFEEAAASYRLAADVPDNAYEALTKLGMTLAALRRQADALEALDRAVALQPGEALARFRRAIVRLQEHDFAGGWADYEARWRVETHLAQSAGVVPREMVPRLATPAAAQDLAGKRILLLGEQGVGDQLMFASMIPDLARTAAQVTCVCEPRLVRLFSASFDGVAFSGPKDADVRPSAIDALLPMGGLGRLYRNRPEDFPGTPYLQPRAEARARWAERLGPRREELRIGVSWRGGVASTRRNARSLSLAQLAPVLDLPGCEFVSLQYGDVRAELEGSPVRAFPAADIDDFEELAGLVANLDLVISVQTALVHLCGAVGTECLTLVPHHPEWRYGTRGPAMPWYRSVRLFRQPEPNAWEPVLQQVAHVLADRLRAPRIGD
jgi:tetratricopeptide (TPR) repeat protein